MIRSDQCATGWVKGDRAGDAAGPARAGHRFDGSATDSVNAGGDTIKRAATGISVLLSN